MSGGFPFALDHPWMALLLFAACVGLAWAIARTSRAEGGRTRKAASLAVRAAVLGLLVLALCGLQWRRERDEMTTIFAVDWSDSTRGAPREHARQWVLQAAQAKRPRDRLAVVQFGRDALIEEGVREDLDELALASTPRPDGSDLATALRLARGLLPADGLRRVVLLTDGSVDGEDPSGAVRDARERGLHGPEARAVVEGQAGPDRHASGEPGRCALDRDQWRAGERPEVRGEARVEGDRDRSDQERHESRPSGQAADQFAAGSQQRKRRSGAPAGPAFAP